MAATFEKAESEITSFTRNGCLFMWGAYFCISAYKRDVFVVIKMGAGAYFVWVLILWYFGTHQCKVKHTD